MLSRRACARAEAQETRHGSVVGTMKNSHNMTRSTPPGGLVPPRSRNNTESRSCDAQCAFTRACAAHLGGASSVNARSGTQVMSGGRRGPLPEGCASVCEASFWRHLATGKFGLASTDVGRRWPHVRPSKAPLRATKGYLPRPTSARGRRDLAQCGRILALTSPASADRCPKAARSPAHASATFEQSQINGTLGMRSGDFRVIGSSLLPPPPSRHHNADNGEPPHWSRSVRASLGTGLGNKGS